MTWHTVKESAPLLGLSEEMVYRLCAGGRLAHRRVGLKPGRGKIQISDAAIEAFLASCEIPSGAGGAETTRKTPKRKTPTFSGRPDGKPITRDWKSR